MTKNMKWAVLIFVLVMVGSCFACLLYSFADSWNEVTAATPTTGVIQQLGPIEQVAPTLEIVQQIVPTEQATLEPVIVPTPESEIDPTVDSVQIYADEIMSVVADWTFGYSQFSELFTAAGNDLTLMDDPTWLGDVYGTMDIMTAANVRLRASTPPEQFIPSHQSLLEAATHMDTAMSLLRAGIPIRDLPSILAATEQISLGTEDIVRATDLLDGVTR